MSLKDASTLDDLTGAQVQSLYDLLRKGDGQRYLSRLNASEHDVAEILAHIEQKSRTTRPPEWCKCDCGCYHKTRKGHRICIACENGRHIEKAESCEHTSMTPSGQGYICDECGAYLNEYYEQEA